MTANICIIMDEKITHVQHRLHGFLVMINAQKTELMCKAALYEKTEGREPLRIRKRYNESFAGGTLSIVLPAAIAYSLIVFLAAAGITGGEFDLPQGLATGIILIVCFIFLGVVFVVAYHRLSSGMIERRYENIRCSIRKYELYQERIEKISAAAAESADRTES